MSRLLARLNREANDRENAAAVERALREAQADGRRFKTTAAGDPAAMRGVPVITKGVGGTMPRTQPEREAMRRAGKWNGPRV